MTMITAAATEKQINFINDLLDTRDAPEHYKEELAELIENEELTKARASAAIDTLTRCPRLKKSDVKSAMQQLLERVPKSRYAVPGIEVEGVIDQPVDDSYIFCEIKQYKGHLYIRRLHGAPGDYTRSRMSMDLVQGLIDIIETDPYKYVKIFGDLYTCCGSCGAPLTDDRSRELSLGPECRRKFL